MLQTRRQSVRRHSWLDVFTNYELVAGEALSLLRSFFLDFVFCFDISALLTTTDMIAFCC